MGKQKEDVKQTLCCANSPMFKLHMETNIGEGYLNESEPF